VVIAMAVGAQRDDVVRPLESQPLISSMVYLEGLGCRAELARVGRRFERQRANPLPMRRLQVFGVRQPAQRRDRALELLIGRKRCGGQSANAIAGSPA
jgi:hypothetical protein